MPVPDQTELMMLCPWSSRACPLHLRMASLSCFCCLPSTRGLDTSVHIHTSWSRCDEGSNETVRQVREVNKDVFDRMAPEARQRPLPDCDPLLAVHGVKMLPVSWTVNIGNPENLGFLPSQNPRDDTCVSRGFTRKERYVTRHAQLGSRSLQLLNMR